MRFLVILCIIASIFAVSLDKAVAYLISHAESRSIGKCGLYVHRALEAVASIHICQGPLINIGQMDF